MSSSAPLNRLARETSPYLLQHQHNPVDWYPWGEEAFAKARAENKPILLSIGYAACHWCHVMAHESFENPETAALMNQLFVNVKIDREERPDLDAIYQRALALIGQQGGWPLTMFVTPDGQPFWGGTYFPPETKWGRVAFSDIMRQISKIYREQQDKVSQTIEALQTALKESLAPYEAAHDLSLSITDRIAERLLKTFDERHGGMGEAPKFPQVPMLHLLWRAYLRTGLDSYQQAVTNTLDYLCQGGIYDHLGGGFARYAVDERWLIPHFEKMLYDNGQLIEILSLVYAKTKSPLYRDRVEETIDWLLRDMTQKDGDLFAFTAAYDADSEGVEGKFYVWDEAEIDAVLGPDAALFKQHYDVSKDGNWEHKNILNRLHAMKRSSDDVESKLRAARKKLFSAREKRVKPGWDYKVLADWNGLAIAGLIQASHSFKKPEWLDAARKVFAFIEKNLSDGAGLRHSYANGAAKNPATLDDYATMIRAALLLFEATSTPHYLHKATEWLSVLDRDFWDGAGAGYFYTSESERDLILRIKSATDQATPSGQAVMIENLIRLYYCTGDEALREKAGTIIDLFSGEIGRNFYPLPAFLCAHEFFLKAKLFCVLPGQDAKEAGSFLDLIHTNPSPFKVVYILQDGAALPPHHPASGKSRLEDKTTVYVCDGARCFPPITYASHLELVLSEQA